MLLLYTTGRIYTIKFPHITHHYGWIRHRLLACVDPTLNYSRYNPRINSKFTRAIEGLSKKIRGKIFWKGGKSWEIILFTVWEWGVGAWLNSYSTPRVCAMQSSPITSSLVHPVTLAAGAEQEREREIIGGATRGNGIGGRTGKKSLPCLPGLTWVPYCKAREGFRIQLFLPIAGLIWHGQCVRCDRV